jgi:hypothetical protein
MTEERESVFVCFSYRGIPYVFASVHRASFLAIAAPKSAGHSRRGSLGRNAIVKKSEQYPSMRTNQSKPMTRKQREESATLSEAQYVQTSDPMLQQPEATHGG